MDAMAEICCRTHFDRRPAGLPRGHAGLALLRSALDMKRLDHQAYGMCKPTNGKSVTLRAFISKPLPNTFQGAAAAMRSACKHSMIC
jgi:hypothetical protein